MGKLTHMLAHGALMGARGHSGVLLSRLWRGGGSVIHTPELLAVLKDAGVVDAGGKGLFFILEGMLRFVYGQPLDVSTAAVQPLATMKLENTMESIEPGQDFEVGVD